jgi:uncharacterized membrane protein (UPF0127 family)
MSKRKVKAQRNRQSSGKRRLSAKGKQKPAVLVGAILAMGLILALFVVKPYIQPNSNKQAYKSTGIAFEKEGELSFYSGHDRELISTIDIEIAEDDEERARGLMHRYSMDNNHGMLFIMEYEEPQSFWMKNTYISLDILYLNKDREIVKIYKNAQPLSDRSLPSIKNSKYIVEVNGGYCDKYNIIEGDFINYNRLPTKD